MFKNSLRAKLLREPSGGPRRGAAGQNPADDPNRRSIKSALLRTVAARNRLPSRVEAQLVVAVAQAARLEWPHAWPDLLPGIASCIRADRLRGLALLYAVLNELSTLRLPDARAARAEACQKLLRSLLPAWRNAGADGDMKMTLVSTRCVRHMLVYGVVQPFPFSQAQRAALEGIAALLGSTGGSGGSPAVAAARAEVKCEAARALCECAEYHPASFSAHAAPFVGVAVRVLEGGGDGGSAAEKAAEKDQEARVYLIRFLRELYKCAFYGRNPPRPRAPYGVDPARLEFDPKKAAMAADALRAAVPRLARLCVTRLMPLTRADLDMWATDAENFAHTAHRLHMYEALRPAAEALLWDLVKTHRKAVGPLILGIFKKALEMQPLGSNIDTNPRAVLAKDALYYAIGLTSVELEQWAHTAEATNRNPFNFSAWYSDYLRVELGADAATAGKATSLMRRVLQRRVLFVIGEFAPSFRGVGGAVRRDMCAQALRLAGPQTTDMAVRLAALGCLRSMMDATATPEEFAKLFAKALGALAGAALCLASDASDAETMREALGFLIFLFAKAKTSARAGDGAGVVGMVGTVVDGVPALWRAAQRENVVRVQILATVQSMLDSCGTAAAIRAAPLVGRLVAWCVESRPAGSGDGGSTERMYLLEPALELWAAALRNTPAPSRDFANLFTSRWGAATAAVAEAPSPGLVEACLAVAHANALLHSRLAAAAANASVLDATQSTAAAALVRGVLSMSRSYRRSECVMAVNAGAMRLAFALPPRVYGQAFTDFLVQIIKDMASRATGAGSVSASSRGPSRCGGPPNALVLCNHAHLIGMLVCAHWDLIAGLLARAGSGGATAVRALMAAWRELFDTFILPRSSRYRARLSAFALLRLLTRAKSDAELLREHAGGVITAAVRVLHKHKDRERAGADSKIGAGVPNGDDSDSEGRNGTGGLPHAERVRRARLDRDPTRNASLQAAVLQCAAEVAGTRDPKALRTWLARALASGMAQDTSAPAVTDALGLLVPS